MAKVLVVDDEKTLVDTIRYNLEREGLSVFTAFDGEEAVIKARKEDPDLIILDVMLPELNGFDVCEQIRKENTKIPILFLTAKGSSSDKIQGLKLGADDYITKPFNLEELLLRVQILVKRGSPQIESDKSLESYSFGENKVNFITYEIIGINGKAEISKKEIALMKLLIERKGEVVSREEILDSVWGRDAYPSSRTIDNYILAFRKYFEKNQREPIHFHSIRGVGYKFTE